MAYRRLVDEPQSRLVHSRSSPVARPGAPWPRCGMEAVSLDPVDVGAVPADLVEVDASRRVEDHALGFQGPSLGGRLPHRPGARSGHRCDSGPAARARFGPSPGVRQGHSRPCVRWSCLRSPRSARTWPHVRSGSSSRSRRCAGIDPHLSAYCPHCPTRRVIPTGDGLRRDASGGPQGTAQRVEIEKIVADLPRSMHQDGHHRTVAVDELG